MGTSTTATMSAATTAAAITRTRPRRSRHRMPSRPPPWRRWRRPAPPKGQSTSSSLPGAPSTKRTRGTGRAALGGRVRGGAELHWPVVDAEAATAAAAARRRRRRRDADAAAAASAAADGARAEEQCRWKGEAKATTAKTRPRTRAYGEKDKRCDEGEEKPERGGRARRRRQGYRGDGRGKRRRCAARFEEVKVGADDAAGGANGDARATSTATTASTTATSPPTRASRRPTPLFPGVHSRRLLHLRCGADRCWPVTSRSTRGDARDCSLHSSAPTS